MSDSRSERLLAYARELEQRDRRLAEAIDAIAQVEEGAAQTRSRAVSVDALLARFPGEHATAVAACDAARAELERRRDELAAAEAAVDRARNEAQRLEAKRAAARAADAAHNTERTLAAADAHRDRLEQEARAAELEAPLLEHRARDLATQLRALPRVSAGATADPAPGLAGVDEWGARVRAALFVARSNFEAEREKAIREANELAASVLGEPLAATSVVLARERLERTLGATEGLEAASPPH